jgi:hypothetical protein
MKKPEHLKVPLKIIPEPEPNTRTVFLLQGLFPAFKGEGDIDKVCGNCGLILLEGVGRGIEIRNLVIRCPKCKSYNELP